jgi:hypothetical protein
MSERSIFLGCVPNVLSTIEHIKVRGIQAKLSINSNKKYLGVHTIKKVKYKII